MTDLEFVQRCVKGERKAWDEFLNKYSRLIYNYIYNVLNSKTHPFNQDDVRDIFQEILCELIKDDFRKLKSFKGKNGSSLASWLRQVTINFTIDYTRKFKPAVSLEEDNEDGLNLKEILKDSSVRAPDLLTLEEKLNSLKDCIENLEVDDKYFLELTMNRGLSLEELKVHFKISRGAIDMRKSRIIERLKDCFKRKGFRLDL